MYLSINLFCTVFSMIVVVLKAPVIHFNKKVSNVEKKHYKKFSIEICLIETLIILLLTTVLPRNKMVMSLTIGQASVAVSMIAAIVKNIFAKNKIM